MDDETAVGSARTSDSSGRPPGGGGESAPLQSRAHFLKNWSWSSVAQINAGLCQRGGAQRGLNSETHEFLRSCHRKAPFLFFNGNTFAEIGRALANALFSELPLQRRKEASSSVAHFITGVLDQGFMISALGSLWEAACLAPGDRVKTLRGSSHGVVLRVLRDGRVAWKPDGTKAELLALPESLLRE